MTRYGGMLQMSLDKLHRACLRLDSDEETVKHNRDQEHAMLKHTSAAVIVGVAVIALSSTPQAAVYRLTDQVVTARNPLYTEFPLSFEISDASVNRGTF